MEIFLGVRIMEARLSVEKIDAIAAKIVAREAVKDSEGIRGQEMGVF